MNKQRYNFRENDPRRRLILALDLPGETEALKLADQLHPDLTYVKVGLQLFSAAGPSVVRKLVSMGLRVFLDLKLHDIPNTMAGAVSSISRMGVAMTTVHAGAGAIALESACREALAAERPGPIDQPPAILAVTMLTSLDEQAPAVLYGSTRSISSMAEHLAKIAVKAGCPGLVASPKEILPIREEVGPDPILVIPGIRPAGSTQNDQSRIATPAQALRSGADFLVVGRPISQDPRPREALLRILDEMADAL